MSRTHTGKRYRFVFALITLVILATAFGLMRSHMTVRQPALTDCLISNDPGAYSMSNSCLVQTIPKLLEHEGAQSLLSYISAATTTKSVRINCHGIAHMIGAYEFKHEGTVEKALMHCTQDCAGGCLHGAVAAAAEAEYGASADAEDAVHDDKALLRIAKKYCNSADLCHAVGHLLFNALREFNPAFHGCDTVASGTNTEQCREGVFMESLGGGSAGGFMDAPDLSIASSSEAYPCDSVQQPYRPACFKYLPAFEQARFKSEKVTDTSVMVQRERAVCLSFAGTDRMQCIYGIGLNASGRIFQNNPAEAATFCGTFSSPDERDACTIGLVTNWIQFNRAPEALALCAGIKDVEPQHTCFGNAFEHLTHKYDSNAVSHLCDTSGVQLTCLPEYGRYLSDPTASVAHEYSLLGRGLW